MSHIRKRATRIHQKLGIAGLIAAAVALIVALTLAPAASANPLGEVSLFSSGLNSGAHPWGIAAGPDGNRWFTDGGTTKAIGKITPSGTITEIPCDVAHGASASCNPYGIAADSAGNLWFTDQATPAIGKIKPTTGHITEFGTANGLNAGAAPAMIAAGPDGNLWFTDNGTTPAIGRITPSGTITESPLPAGSRVLGITAGPAGEHAMWFANQRTHKIGKVDLGTSPPTITESDVGLQAGKSGPTGIAAGPDGNLWFTDAAALALGEDKLGKLNPGTWPAAGSVTEYNAGLQSGGAKSLPVGIAAGPDGNVWFTDEGSPLTGAEMIGRITPTGAISEYPLPSGSEVPPYFTGTGIAAGSDGSMWFSDDGTPIAIGRVGTGFSLLTVFKGGNGEGTVTSLAPNTGIACLPAEEECSHVFANGEVELEAEAKPGSVFAGWIGCHHLTATTCKVPVTAASEVTAVFLEKAVNGTNGSNGTNGTNGAAGPAGPQGAQGPAGPTGKIVCKAKQKGHKIKVTCTIKASASNSSARLRWRLMHAGHAVSHGRTAGRHLNLRLSNLRPGRYVLHFQGQREGTVIVVS